MNELGVFAKFWQAGQVKTRLAYSLGAVAASQIYFAFLQCIGQRFAEVGQRRIIAVTPVDNQSDFRELKAFHAFQIERQSDGNLGARMLDFFTRRFASGAERVILIGSDSPNIPLNYFELGFELLASSDVILGPSDDGGYYLIGMSRLRSEVFDDISWSTGNVFEETRARLESSQVSYKVLPNWYDVDDRASLDRLIDDIQTEHGDPFLVDLRQSVQSVSDGTSNHV